MDKGFKADRIRAKALGVHLDLGDFSMDKKWLGLIIALVLGYVLALKYPMLYKGQF